MTLLKSSTVPFSFPWKSSRCVPRSAYPDISEQAVRRWWAPSPVLQRFQQDRLFLFQVCNPAFQLRTICRIDCIRQLAAVMSRFRLPILVCIPFFHLADRWPHVDSGDLLDPLSLIGAKVKTFRAAIGFQIAVGRSPPSPAAISRRTSGRSSPRCPPCGFSSSRTGAGYARRSRQGRKPSGSWEATCPCSSIARMVSRMWAWGFPSPLSWMAKSAIMPLETKNSRQ